MRYDNAPILKTKHGRRYYEGLIYPQITPKETDIYVITNVGDRLDILAQQYYNDSSLWWIISAANDIRKDSIFIAPGTQLRVPINIDFLDDFNKVNQDR